MMKMIYKHKETCSCGAILEIEENVDKAYESHIPERQRDFLEAHAECRFKSAVEN